MIEQKREEILEVETKSKQAVSHHQSTLDSTKLAHQQQYQLWKNQNDELGKENISLKNQLNALTVKLNEEEFQMKISEQNYVRNYSIFFKFS